MRPRTAGNLIFLLMATLALGCGDKTKPAEQTNSEDTKQVETTPPSDNATASQGTTGRHRDNGDWIPAEYKSGKGRWKDAAAYVDGVPVGMLWFGELPSTLKPVWVEQIEGLDFKPGDPPPYEKVVTVRRYRFSDYFEAVGVDLEKVKELHLYGPNNQVRILTGKRFMEVKDRLYFRFGLGTHGKAIAVIPKDIGKNFDRLMAAIAYVDKKPPIVGEDEDGNEILLLDGKPVNGIPYFGEPLRGGIRIYKDDRFAASIKRNKLDPKQGKAGTDGKPRWHLFTILESIGVATKDVVQAEVIYDERRGARFDRSTLESMNFRSIDQGRGTLELNDKTPIHALALYSKPLPPKKVVSSKPKNETAKNP